MVELGGRWVWCGLWERVEEGGGGSSPHGLGIGCGASGCNVARGMVKGDHGQDSGPPRLPGVTMMTGHHHRAPIQSD